MFKTYAGVSAQAGGGGPVSRVGGPSAGGPGPGGWEPSVLFLVGLTVGEIVFVALLSRHLFGGS